MSHALFLQLLLADPNVPDAFKAGARSHELSPEARQSLDDDFAAEMRQEARERREMDEGGEQ